MQLNHPVLFLVPGTVVPASVLLYNLTRDLLGSQFMESRQLKGIFHNGGYVWNSELQTSANHLNRLGHVILKTIGTGTTQRFVLLHVASLTASLQILLCGLLEN